MTTQSIIANNLIFDTSLFDYSTRDNFVLVPQTYFELNRPRFISGDIYYDDVLSEEDINDIRIAREEFKRGEYVTAEQVKQKYGL